MPPTNKPSALIEALNRLNDTPAIPICHDTSVPMPDSRYVIDHYLATYAARSKEGFVFIPDESIWQTYSILRSAANAWQHDKLPVLAICAFTKSPAPMQRETGIQADTADQFLKDLTPAHRIVPKLGESPSYIVRHYPWPNEIYDDVILPAHTNLIIYQPHALSHTQLTRLFEHVASVNGKAILCDDRGAFANSHPELTDAVERSISKAIPHGLRRKFERPVAATPDLQPHINIEKPVSFPNVPELNGDSHAPGTQQSFQFNNLPPGTPYLIYHAKTPNAAEFPSGYVLVAKVEAESIHRALANSQDFGAPWTENPGVTAFTHRPRSTRPGDLIVHDCQVQRIGAAEFETVAVLKQSPKHSPEPSRGDLEPDAPEPGKPKQKLKP